MGEAYARAKAWGQRTFQRLPHPVQFLSRVGWTTSRQYGADNASAFAAAIAYYAIFSIIPLAQVALWILGWVYDTETIVDFVFEQLPLEETAETRANVESIVVRSKELSQAGIPIAIIALIWSASGFFAAIRRGLDATTGIPPKERRPFWQAKLIDVALVPAIGLLLFALIAGTVALQYLVELAGRSLNINTSMWLDIALFLLTFGATYMLFAGLYRYMPSERRPWNGALVAAGGAVVVFEVARSLFSLILANQTFTKESAIYASIGSALAFLLAVFMTANILLIGAEFARAWTAERRAIREARGEDPGVAPDVPERRGWRAFGRLRAQKRL